MAKTSDDKTYDLPMPLEIGQVFAGYTILRVLGTGGMGNVYLTSHPRLPREDALKVLPVDVTTDPEFRARFQREAELAAGLSHPNIVRIHDRGEEDGQFWISMAYVAGTDAGKLLQKDYPGGLPLDEALPIISAVASALDYAHHRGLLHRDVKPANILLADPDGQMRRIFLADFGIARRIDDAVGLTATNMTVGTASYAAPEQLRGQSVDGRADQYALACTAFHLLTGSAPYVDSNPAVVISKHVNAPPPSIVSYRPELAWLDPVFAIAMAKQPAGRFSSCGEFAAHLAGQVALPTASFAYAGEIDSAMHATRPDADLTAPVFPPLTAPPAGKSRRSRVLIPALLGVVLLLVAGGIFAAMKLTKSDRPTASAPSAAVPTSAAPPPNTGPFTGVYRADFGRVTGIDGEPATGVPPTTTDTYAVRSACGANGCVATVSHLSGDTMQFPTLVFDQVGTGWIGVSLNTTKCGAIEGEVWEVLKLQPQPNGNLTGEATQTLPKGCNNKRPVTFTRTGDVDINTLPDPAAEPARVVSPAEALHGRYHQTDVAARGYKEQNDYTVVTDCVRTGERCVSLFHKPPGNGIALMFGDGHWVYDREMDAPCTTGGRSHIHINVQFPMPQPPQNPVTLLTGHGDVTVVSGPPACKSTGVAYTFTRTGD